MIRKINNDEYRCESEGSKLTLLRFAGGWALWRVDSNGLKRKPVPFTSLKALIKANPCWEGVQNLEKELGPDCYPLKVEVWNGITGVVASKGHHDVVDFFEDCKESGLKIMLEGCSYLNAKHLWMLKRGDSYLMTTEKAEGAFPVTLVKV